MSLVHMGMESDQGQNAVFWIHALDCKNMVNELQKTDWFHSFDTTEISVSAAPAVKCS